MTDQATPAKVRLTDGLGPVAWAVVAFGRMQKLVVRADVADELACAWRKSDPEATAVPLYTWGAVEFERERCAKIVDLPPGTEAWEVIGGEEGLTMLRELAAQIRGA